MKKLVFVLPFFFSVICSVCAAPVISEDFYLNNGVLRDENAVDVMNILPNTLRLEIVEGEGREIYAEVIPDNATETELVWSLPDNAGAISIYPKGERCTVYGVHEGQENIRVEAESGVSADIAVEVKKEAEIQTRSFEFEGADEEKAPIFTDGVMRFIVRFLITLSAVMLLAVVLFVVRRRGWKRR